MPLITEMFAFVVSDTAPDDEGVIAFLDPATGQWLPMVGADPARVDSLRKMAQAIANTQGKPIRLYRFTHKEHVETINPKGDSHG